MLFIEERPRILKVVLLLGCFVATIITFINPSTYVIRPVNTAKGDMRLIDASIKGLVDGLKQREFTSVSLVETYITRTQQVNSIVRAVSEINPDAIEIARERDEERLNGRIRGLLHGIPFLAKDVFLTTDRMETTAGCNGLKGARALFEATVITKLRDQGAILLGKTTLTEWANYRNPGTAPNGWSAVNGQATAPYAEDQDPSGSSSGSAIAVGLGLCAFGIGTETEGSITNPAQRSAVIGLKPTTGLTSRHGGYMVSEWQDSVGIHGRTVEDCAIALSAIAGVDPQDPFTLSDIRDRDGIKRPSEHTNFASSLSLHGLQGIRIAVPPKLLDQDKARNGATKEAIQIMRNNGAIIIEDAEFPNWLESDEKKNQQEWSRSFRMDLRNNMVKYLSSFEPSSTTLRTLADVINYTKSTLEERFEEYGAQEWLAAEQEGHSYDPFSLEYFTSLMRRIKVGYETKRLLDKYECDVYLCSASRWQPAMAGGCPTISIPIGSFPEDTPVTRRKNTGLVQKAPGIPFSIVMTARRWDDKKLIDAAYAFEQASNVRSKLKLVVEPAAELEVNTAQSVGRSSGCL